MCRLFLRTYNAKNVHIEKGLWCEQRSFTAQRCESSNLTSYDRTLVNLDQAQYLIHATDAYGLS